MHTAFQGAVFGRWITSSGQKSLPLYLVAILGGSAVCVNDRRREEVYLARANLRQPGARWRFEVNKRPTSGLIALMGCLGYAGLWKAGARYQVD